jgi:hypothetical protein
MTLKGKVEYTKLTIDDEKVISLSKLTNETRETICSMLNNQLYRKSYNRQRNQTIKQLNERVKELESQISTK